MEFFIDRLVKVWERHKFYSEEEFLDAVESLKKDPTYIESEYVDFIAESVEPVSVEDNAFNATVMAFKENEDGNIEYVWQNKAETKSTEGVQIVTIKELLPLYKDGSEALKIQLATMEENDFKVVVGKGIYNVGDRAIYIQPDYCLPDSELFGSFTKPDGDVNKSKLGKNNRIRAIKFNFSDGKAPKVYSNGILMPYETMSLFIQIENYTAAIEKRLPNYAEVFDVTKYEEPETSQIGNAKGNLPSGIYKTDETNINNLKKEITAIFEDVDQKNRVLIGTLKVDGSSITIYYKDENTYGICSRSQEKKLFDENGNVSQDDWVQLGMPILEKLKTYKKPLVIRGEIFGSSLKGSGNKKNFSKDYKKTLWVFGIDDYSSGVAIPMAPVEYTTLAAQLELQTVPVIFTERFDSVEELKQKCQEYFENNEFSKDGKLVEGIVVRTFYNNSFSAKIMNDAYDAEK